MTVLSFVFLLVFAFNVTAQTATTDRLFADGSSYANAGDFDAALKTYKAALAAAEKKYAGKESLARLHYNIGLCYFQLNRFDEAANEFKTAMLLKTDYSQAYVALNAAKARARSGIDLKTTALRSTAGN